MAIRCKYVDKEVILGRTSTLNYNFYYGGKLEVISEISRNGVKTKEKSVEWKWESNEDKIKLIKPDGDIVEYTIRGAWLEAEDHKLWSISGKEFIDTYNEYMSYGRGETFEDALKDAKKWMNSNVKILNTVDDHDLHIIRVNAPNEDDAITKAKRSLGIWKDKDFYSIELLKEGRKFGGIWIILPKYKVSFVHEYRVKIFYKLKSN